MFESEGRFGVSFFDDYTLFTIAGAWKEAEAEVLTRRLRQRMAEGPVKERCGLISTRAWGLQTSESCRIIRQLSTELSEYYHNLDMAYYISDINAPLTRRLLEKHNRILPNINWSSFTDLDEAVAWLTARGHKLPPLAEEDFPPALPLSEY